MTAIRYGKDGVQCCTKCDGCGRIANDDEGTPWSFWESLPIRSGAAVLMGLVRPIPCPRCNGSGDDPDPVPNLPFTQDLPLSAVEEQAAHGMSNPELWS